MVVILSVFGEQAKGENAAPIATKVYGHFDELRQLASSDSRANYRVGSQANLSATGKNGYKQKSQLKRMFLRWMRRVYGLYKVPSKRASATVSAFVI